MSDSNEHKASPRPHGESHDSEPVEGPSPIRVVLPYHLRNLARVGDEVELAVAPPVTIASVLDAVEAQYPVLRGTIRDHRTLKRRSFLRFFACQNDLSNDPSDTPLPDEITEGKEPFFVIGAIAGG